MKNKLKRAFVLIASIFVIVACGKTTKGKLENEWKVDSHVETEETYVDGELNSRIVTSFIEEIYTRSSSNFYVGGQVLQHEITINKDGTWSLIREYNFSSFPVNHVKIEQSGTWNFVRKSKNDDVKKNEYVFFHVLSERKLEEELEFQGSKKEEITTFYEGESTLRYRVIESTKDMLKLEKKDSYGGYDLEDSYYENSKISIELSKK